MHPHDAKLVCSPTNTDTYRKINLGSTPLCLETEKILDELCNEYKDIFSLHQGDTDHTRLLIMDIDTDIPPITHYHTENLYFASKKNTNLE